MEPATEYIAYCGMHYKVMERGGLYCARYQQEGKPVWYRSNHVNPRETFEEAQADLDRIALKHGWEKI